MKNLKKIVLGLVMMFAFFAVAACSNAPIETVHEDFLDAGYHQYQYKNYIPRNFNLDNYIVTGEDDDDDDSSSDVISENDALKVIDHMSLEIRGYILAEYDYEDETFEDETDMALDPSVELDVIDDMVYNVFLYGDYEEIDEDTYASKTAIIVEFSSVEYLNEVIEVSQIIKDYLADKDVEDHTNGSLLLFVPENRMEYYDEIVEIFNASEK